jgi:murein DD-endopeptidase MepM/ murein hydrolase activator NlpD
MEFDHNEDLIEESLVTEEQASPKLWKHFIKQGIICAILLVSILWLNRVAPEETLGHVMAYFKRAIHTDAKTSFGFIRRQPIVNQMITWSKDIWSEMEEQPAISEELNLIPPVPGEIRKKFGWISESQGMEPVFHPGVDLEAPLGSVVRASGRGIVQQIRQESDGTWRVTLKHPENNRSIYANCNQVTVRIGERVEVGQEIGRSGNGGNEGQTVHWEVWKGIQPIDPQPFIGVR